MKVQRSIGLGALAIVYAIIGAAIAASSPNLSTALFFIAAALAAFVAAMG